MRKIATPLSRERILQAALKILDEEGLDALSMRKLAATLEVEAMSLYNHVTDKRDLLDGVADLVLTQIDLPDESLPWNQRLESIALKLYEALVRHPNLVVVLATGQGFPKDPKVMQGMDTIIAALAETGLGPNRQVNAYRGLLALCLGFVLVRTVDRTKSKKQAREEWDQWVSSWDANTLPHLPRLAPYFTQTHASDDFQFMLRAYLNHLQVRS